MIDLKTYLEYSNYYRNDQEHIQAIREYNKALIEKYPWLRIGSPTDFDPYQEKDWNDYNWTWMDDVPDGWRIAFGEQMCDEIQKALEKADFVDKYRIVQVKEKFGGLRWYTDGVPINSKLDDIARKYERISEEICVECGRPATYRTTGWICPYCDEHVPHKEHAIPLTLIRERKNG